MLPSVSEIISTTVTTYRKNIGYFLRFMALFFLITFVLGFAEDILFSSHIITIPGLAFIVSLLADTIIGIASLWLYTALIVATKHALDHTALQPFWVVIKGVLPFLLRATLATIAASIIVAVGGIFFIIPGLICLVWYVFSLHEIIFFNQAVVPSFVESKRLVVGRWFAVAWRLFAPLFGLAAVATLVQVVVLLPFSWPHIASLPYTLPVLLVNALVVAILYSVVFPMTTMAGVILFFALKNEPMPISSKPQTSITEA